MRHGKQKTCAKLGCKRPATEAFDVGSWFRAQELIHYEVCEKHATYFAEPFNKDSSKAVRKDLVPWRGIDL